MTGTDITALLCEHFDITAPRGVVFETEHEVAPMHCGGAGFDGRDAVLRPNADPPGSCLVGYLIPDHESRGDPAGYWNEYEDGCELHEFRDPDARREFLAAAAERDEVCIPVECYQRGPFAKYAPASSSNFPDRQWDVSSGYVFVPPPDQQEVYRHRVAREGEGAADTWLHGWCVAVLEQYSQWINGELYGIGVETWTCDGGLPARGGCERYGGLITQEVAIEALREEMGDIPEAAPSTG